MNQMDAQETRRQAGQVIIGTVLVAAGILFLRNRLNLWDGWRFSRLWPILPMIAGARHFLVPRHPRALVSGLLLVGSSAVLLLHTTRMLSLQASWPSFVIIAGVAIMLGGVVCRRTGRRAGSQSYGL